VPFSVGDGASIYGEKESARRFEEEGSGDVLVVTTYCKSKSMVLSKCEELTLSGPFVEYIGIRRWSLRYRILD
jgi:hypothetical protein